MLRVAAARSAAWAPRLRPALTARAFSGIPVIGIADLKKGMREETLTLVDVRNEDEVRQTGELREGPAVALNIPLPRIQEGVLGATEEDFQDEFGFEKPDVADYVVFSCRSGVRSEAAATIAKTHHNYQKALNFKGSANEWFAPK